MVTASFGDYKFDEIEGYRISLALRPGQGFGGNFYVYLCDRVRGPERPSKRLNMGPSSAPPRAILRISGGKRSYEFRGIELTRAEVGVNRQEIVRMLEFRYTPKATDTDNAPVSIENTSDHGLGKGVFDEDYMYNLPGGKGEQLLGVAACLSAVDQTILRCSSIRNATNSILEKVIETSDGMVKDKEMTSFKIGFSAREIEVTHQNLQRVFVEESFGECTRWPTPSLLDYRNNRTEESLSRVRFESASAHELLVASSVADRVADGMSDPQSVEMATFCFLPGFYRDLEIG